jgi:hypothetical protein
MIKFQFRILFPQSCMIYAHVVTLVYYRIEYDIIIIKSKYNRATLVTERESSVEIK